MATAYQESRSLKKYLDSNDEQVLAALVDSYQRLLSVTATCNTELCTQSAGDLATSLHLLEQAVSSQSRPADLIANKKQAELHLHQWRDRTTDYLRQKTVEMQAFLMVVAHPAESIGERDQSHTQRLQGLTQRLQAIAELEDITRLRTGLLASIEEMSQTSSGCQLLQSSREDRTGSADRSTHWPRQPSSHRG